MGLSHITAASYHSPTPLALVSMVHFGLIKTHSSRQKITDCDAGATAFACGKKTYSGAIGVDNDSIPLKNIFEYAKEKGLHIGIIATSSITHAIPAAFYAHQLNRSMEYDIAIDLLSSGVDFFAGGGLKFFNNRPDNRNLIDEFKQLKYSIDTTMQASLKLPCGYLIAKGGLKKASERNDFLDRAVEVSLSTLSSSDSGFFLMVESSQIDWAGHANDSAWLMDEMVELDKVINTVLNFAQNDGNTLVVITADHETGGLSLIDTNRDYNNLRFNFSSASHTAELIPVFAYGPGSINFSGLYSNHNVFSLIKDLIAFKGYTK